METFSFTIKLNKLDKMNFIRRYHISDVGERLYDQLLNEVEQVVTPMAFVSVVQQEVQVVATLGEALDQLQAAYCEKVLLSEAYMIDCFGMYYLEKLYEEICKKCEELYGISLQMAFPEGEYACKEAAQIVTEMNQDVVRVLDGLSLYPKKSVAYYLRVVDNCERENNACGKQESASRHICALCTKTDCPNREVVNLTYGYQRIFGKR